MTIKISDYDALTSAATGDLLEIVDISDTTMAATGTNKKITLANLIAGIAPNYVTGIVSTIGTITTNTPAFSATQTWNDAGVTFKGLFLNVTATAKAAASRLLDLQESSVSQFAVSHLGNVTLTGDITLADEKYLKSTTGGRMLGYRAADARIHIDFDGVGAEFGFYFCLGSSNDMRWLNAGATAFELGIGKASAGVLEVTSGTAGTLRDILVRQIFIDGAATSAAAGQISIGADTRTTIGANGGASALTANPVGYIDIYVGSTAYQIPYYSRGA